MGHKIFACDIFVANRLPSLHINQFLSNAYCIRNSSLSHADEISSPRDRHFFLNIRLSSYITDLMRGDIGTSVSGQKQTECDKIPWFLF